MGTKKFFDILGINESSTLQDAKRAYRKKVKENHPDRLANHPSLKKPAEEKMKEINVAYNSVISFLKEREQTELVFSPKKAPEKTRTKSKDAKNKSKKTRFNQTREGEKYTQTPTKGSTNTLIDTIDLILDELRKFNLKKQIFKRAPKKKPRPERPQKKEPENFDKIFNEILTQKKGRAQRPARSPNIKRKVSKTQYKNYSRPQFRPRESGPIEGIKPVSRVKGIYRDD